MTEVKFKIIHEDQTYYWGYTEGGFASIPSSTSMPLELAKKLSCQYTGFKDKNKKEIYRKDILKIAVQRLSGSHSSWYQKRNINHKEFYVYAEVYWNIKEGQYQLKYNEDVIKKLEQPIGKERIEHQIHINDELWRESDNCEIVGTMRYINEM